MNKIYCYSLDAQHAVHPLNPSEQLGIHLKTLQVLFLSVDLAALLATDNLCDHPVDLFLPNHVYGNSQPFHLCDTHLLHTRTRTARLCCWLYQTCEQGQIRFGQRTWPKVPDFHPENSPSGNPRSLRAG